MTERPSIRVLDLDGSVTAQRELAEKHSPEVVPMRDWGPRVRICCSFGSFRHFEHVLEERLGDAAAEPAVTFCGSGDFHHVTAALLGRLREPFNLLVLDKHPDWTRGAPVMHCGTWVPHVLKLPNLKRMFHIGGALDLENVLYWFAPWRQLLCGTVRIAPAVHRPIRGMWKSVPCAPLREAPDRPMTDGRLETLFGEMKDELGRFPLYISIDKDVMQASDAPVNWDSGRLELDEVRRALGWFIGASAGRMIGMDVHGDWSPPRMQGLLRKMLNVTEHPKLTIDPEEAAAVNCRTNLALMETAERAIAATQTSA